MPHDLGALRMLSNRRALHHPRSFAASADSAVIVDPGQIPTEDRCAPFKRRYRPSAIKIDPLKSTRRNRVVSGIVLPPLRIASRWPCSIWFTASSSAYDEGMATGIKRRHKPPRILGDLLSAEIAEKQARSIKYQLTIAKLPLAKDIDNFDFTGTPINEALIRDLASGGFLAEQRNTC